MSWRRLREHSLEEGNHVTARTVGAALTDWLAEHVPWRTYAASWVFLVVVLSAAEYVADGSHEDVVRNPVDYASLYRSVPSLPVGDDLDVAGIVRQMQATADEYDFTCLAAVHIGYPLRVALVKTPEWDTIILINPVVVAGEGGERVSRGEETSAFGGVPQTVARLFPVTVRDREGFHLFDHREDAHCVRHLLGQMDGDPFV